MNEGQSYFFCGVGGSGMLPLSLIVKARGATVSGSDRALDQGRTAPKFEFLKGQGLSLFAQDGSGVTSAEQILVASAAVEETVPDIQAARRVGAKTMTRAELLSQLFNAAPQRIGVAGTSGKSTTTGMIAWILHEAGLDPTVVNGAEMKNFATAEIPFSSARIGGDDVFLAEVDESDGSIARYRPTIAVVGNMAHDHKSMEELRELFTGFIDKSEIAVLNLDNEETQRMALRLPPHCRITFSLTGQSANLMASVFEPQPGGITFRLTERDTGEVFWVRLRVPGAHNAANAMAAIGAAMAAGVPIAEAVWALTDFTGIRRRLEVVGEAEGVIVIDDFAHNPDKIAATLATLHAFPGRLLVMFQPHGFGPLKLMREGFVETFAEDLRKEDVLLMPEPVYFGGTADRSVSSSDITAAVGARGVEALALPDRDACGRMLLELARPGDRIVVMGARDDTLSVFAADLLAELKGRGFRTS